MLTSNHDDLRLTNIQNIRLPSRTKEVLRKHAHIFSFYYIPDSITLVGQRWANGTCTDGPTVAATGGPLWACPTSLCWPTGGYSHRWASVGPPLGQRWLATGGPLLAHRWLATVGPTVGQRYTNDKCAVGPTMASHR